MSPDSRKGRPDSGPTTITECVEGTADGPRVATVAARPSSLRRYRRRRWARRHLDALDDGQAVISPWLAPCARCHPGPCDYWGACSGMNLTVYGRQAAGSVHPWKVSA